MPSYCSFIFSLKEIINSLKTLSKKGCNESKVLSKIELEIIYKIVGLMIDHMVIDKKDYEDIMKI